MNNGWTTVPEASWVVLALSSMGRTVATAESLTGGLLGAAITSVPGASKVYRGGLVVYATDLKASLGGVDPELLAVEGAVSGWTARELARGAAERCGADFGLSTTGVAGPDPQEGHAPGTVFVGLHGPGPSGVVVTEAEMLQLDGDRAEVRRATVTAALDRFLRTFGLS